MFKQFASFDKMLTPTIIKIIFWIGVVLSVLSGLVQMVEGGVGVLSGLLTIIIGPLFVRIYCEMLIIFFKIHDSINKLNDKVESLKSNRD